MPAAVLDPGATITRIALASCFVPHFDDHSIWDSVTATDPDVFLFLGDNVYASVDLDNPDLPELKEGYALLAQSGPFSKLRQATPLMVTWDDHDYGLNDAGGDWPIKYRSEQLFEHVWAIPEGDPRLGRDGVYHAKIIGPAGRRVQIIMLDTRFFRSPLKPTDSRGTAGKERYLLADDPAKTMLGEAQWTWLEGWHTLPLERRRLYDLIGSTGANGVVILSGDRHVAGFYHQDRNLPYTVTEFTSSAMNIPVTGGPLERISKELGPNRDGAVFTDPNFGTLNIDWETGLITLEIRRQGGEVARAVSVRISDLQG